MSWNRVIMLGNLVRDPETRNVATTTITQFTVASTHAYKGKDGTMKKESAFIDCKLWAARGVKFAESALKGTTVFVEGRMVTESWEKDGQKRSKLVVSVDDYKVFDRTTAPASQAVATTPAIDAMDDDPPF